jgi:hypothetical protein
MAMPTRRRNPIAAIGRWSTSHPWRAGESGRGYAMLDQHELGRAQYDHAFLHSGSVRVGDPAFRAAIADVRARMRNLLDTRVTVRFSSNGHSALLTGRATNELSALQTSLAAAAPAHPRVQMAADGPGSGTSTSDSDLHRAEMLALPVTLFVLLVAFGSLVGSLVPMLLGLTAVVAAFGPARPDQPCICARQQRQDRRALDGHGRRRRLRALLRDPLARGAQARALVARGARPHRPHLRPHRGGRRQIPFLPHLHADSRESRLWPAVVERVLRRPVASLLAGAALLVALAIPALGLHIAEPSSDTLTPQPSAALLDRMRADFPSTSEPALLVVTAPRSEQPRVRRGLTRLESLAAAKGIAHPPFTLDTSRDGRAAVVALPLTGLGDNAASRNAISVLRNELVPETLGHVHGVETAVTGSTAEDVDFTHQIEHGIRYVMAFVLGLAFVLLLVTFRSIVVPLKAIVLNLLSVAASYGVLALVFQHHWAQGLLGFHSNGELISWVPLFLFVVLFGLSMDYHVFILSRVREAYGDGMSSDEAVRYGITRTAGVVTSAALVMVGVFSIFGTLNQLDVKQAGVGLAAAILIDATIVRGVLLPASMTLLGDWNWYLPRWLDWLPRMHRDAPRRHEIPVATPAAATAYRTTDNR